MDTLREILQQARIQAACVLNNSRELSLVMTKLDEAEMWAERGAR